MKIYSKYILGAVAVASALAVTGCNDVEGMTEEMAAYIVPEDAQVETLGAMILNEPEYSTSDLRLALLTGETHNLPFTFVGMGYYYVRGEGSSSEWKYVHDYGWWYFPESTYVFTNPQVLFQIAYSPEEMATSDWFVPAGPLDYSQNMDLTAYHTVYNGEEDPFKMHIPVVAPLLMEPGTTLYYRLLLIPSVEAETRYGDIRSISVDSLVNPDPEESDLDIYIGNVDGWQTDGTTDIVTKDF